MRSLLIHRKPADLHEPPVSGGHPASPSSAASTSRKRGRSIVARLLSDERGAVLLEYTALTGFVAIVALPALVLCGLAVAGSFVFVRGYMLYPFP
jgi:Flp pilus assembly pilin Flp